MGSTPLQTRQHHQHHQHHQHQHHHHHQHQHHQLPPSPPSSVPAAVAGDATLLSMPSQFDDLPSPSRNLVYAKPTTTNESSSCCPPYRNNFNQPYIDHYLLHAPHDHRLSDSCYATPLSCSTRQLTRSLLAGMFGVVLMGVSCFLIGLSSYADVQDFPLLSFTPLNASYYHQQQQQPQQQSGDGDGESNSSNETALKIFRNQMYVWSGGFNESLLVATKLKDSDETQNEASNDSSSYSVLAYEAACRVTLDLSVLWLINGFAGLLVGFYLWLNYGSLLLASPTLDVVLPSQGSFEVPFLLSPESRLASADFEPLPEMVSSAAMLNSLTALNGSSSGGGGRSIDPAQQVQQVEKVQRSVPKPAAVGTAQGLIRPLKEEESQKYWHESPDKQTELSVAADFYRNMDGSATTTAAAADAATIERVCLHGDRQLSSLSSAPSLFRQSTTAEIVSSFTSYVSPMISGLSFAASQASLKIGFWAPVVTWPSITALSGCDGVIVALIFSHFFKIYPDRQELLFLCLMFAGACVIPLLSWMYELSMHAVLCGLVSAACIATSAAFARVGALSGVSGFTSFSTRSVTQGIVGLLGFAVTIVLPRCRNYLVSGLSERREWLRILLLPAAAGVTAVLSVAALNIALLDPMDVKFTVVLPLHSLIVTVLCWFVFQSAPPLLLFVAFLVVWGSCLLLAFRSSCWGPTSAKLASSSSSSLVSVSAAAAEYQTTTIDYSPLLLAAAAAVD